MSLQHILFLSGIFCRFMQSYALVPNKLVGVILLVAAIIVLLLFPFLISDSAPGIGSGLDVKSIVSQLVALEKQPLTKLQLQAATVNTKISTYGQIKSLGLDAVGRRQQAQQPDDLERRLRHVVKHQSRHRLGDRRHGRQ